MSRCAHKPDLTQRRQVEAMAALLRALRAEGTISIGAITRALTERKVPPPRGVRWHISSTANLLARAQKLAELG
jgi:hypothetical protein